MSSATAAKPSASTTATKIAAELIVRAAAKASAPTKPVERPSDPDIGGESFDYAT